MMQAEGIPRDFQVILLNSLESRISHISKRKSKNELKTLLQEMRHIVMTYSLDDDIVDSMSVIVDKILALISVNNIHNKDMRQTWH